MATPNPLGSNQSITLERNKTITITKRTVRFSHNVYQTHNITGFSEGEVEIGTIPWGIIIVVLFIIGPIVGIANNGIGSALILAAIGGAVWNFAKPKHYGLLLTFNSGHQTLFVTDDKTHLKEKINTIYELIEKAEDKTYELSILNSTVSGQFIMGTDNRM
jgi:hypothetical protein